MTATPHGSAGSFLRRMTGMTVVDMPHQFKGALPTPSPLATLAAC